MAAFISCHKADDTTAVANPKPDSTKTSRYPYSVPYSGTVKITEWLDEYNNAKCPITSLDTSYPAILLVEYPDSLLVRFHLEWLDFMNASGDGCSGGLSFLGQENLFAVNNLNKYESSRRHHSTTFTQTGDDLTIHKDDNQGTYFSRVIDFNGKKM